MKSKFILTAFFCVCGIMPMAAQWQRTPTPNDTLQSVKVLSDGRIALNIYAPQAKKVDIEGDIIPWGKKPDVMKSVSGVWTVTVPPVKAGAYRYHFIVDGVKVFDPKSPEVTGDYVLMNEKCAEFESLKKQSSDYSDEWLELCEEEESLK